MEVCTATGAISNLPHRRIFTSNQTLLPWKTSIRLKSIHRTNLDVDDLSSGADLSRAKGFMLSSVRASMASTKSSSVKSAAILLRYSFRFGTDAHLYDDPEDVNIAPLLDSRFDSEKCEALKRLLALIAQGFDVSNFFPQIVGILLNDNSPGIVGAAAAAAFASVCPTNLPLIGRNYKRLCEILPDVEEWGQIVLIGILLRYVIARHGLVRESIMLSPYSEYYSSDKNGLDMDFAVKE